MDDFLVFDIIVCVQGLFQSLILSFVQRTFYANNDRGQCSVIKSTIEGLCAAEMMLLQDLS